MAITLVHDCDIERRPVPLALNGDFRDCHLSESSPDLVHDGTQFQPGIYDDKELYNVRALLLFDLNTFIPASATITAAVWWFYVSGTDSLATHSFRAVRCRRNDEGSGNCWKEDEATWNSYKTGSNWSLGGASSTVNDRDEGVIVTIGALDTTGWKSIDFLTLVSDAWSTQGGICTFIMERYDAYMDEVGQAMINAKNMYGAPNYDPVTPHHLRITYTLDGRTFQAMVR